MTKFKHLIYTLLVALVAGNAFAMQSFDSMTNLDDLRSPEQIFKVVVFAESNGIVTLSFDVAPKFYIYRDRLKITGDPQGLLNESMLQIPPGVEMRLFDGESYTEENILTGKFLLTVPLLLHKPANLLVTLQGCDGKTICYPPQKYIFPLNQNISWFTNLKNMFFDIYDGADKSNQLPLHANTFELVLIFFIAGVVLALTPCMYPLYPIALSALTANTAKRSNIIKLTLCYIHGIALVYVVIGVIAATSGKLVTSLIQTPSFVLISSVVLVILGLAMLDLLEIKLPNRFNSYINIKATNLVGGRYTTAFLLGMLSSLLLGPCITPPLVITIGVIASIGNVLVGIVSLYALSLGLCFPIFILSTLGSKFMPKSGSWMSFIKHCLGVVIIAVAINLAYPILNLGAPLLSIGILCFITTLIFLLIKQFRSTGLDFVTHKVLPIFMIITGLAFTVIGARQELTGLSTKNSVIARTTKVSNVKQLLATSQKPVVVIVSAKWCSICREMEDTTFKDTSVAAVLSNNYSVIDFDITDNEAEQIDFLKSYKLYGPPAILVFDKSGKLANTLTGFVSTVRLLNQLK